MTRVKAIESENGAIRAVIAQTKGAPEPLRVECDYLVVNIGSAVNLDAVKKWGEIGEFRSCALVTTPV